MVQIWEIETQIFHQTIDWNEKKDPKGTDEQDVRSPLRDPSYLPSQMEKNGQTPVDVHATTSGFSSTSISKGMGMGRLRKPEEQKGRNGLMTTKCEEEDK